jgi:hypothetical protein
MLTGKNIRSLVDIPVSTGIGGVVCVAAIVGVGALGGTIAGGKVGECVGEKFFESIQP